jgi:ABC-type sugar transport system ATPase subunit
VKALIRFDGITKRFPGVLALSDVSFDVGEGSCHALCGENGAGKSTLGKILAGVYSPDEGRVLLGGVPVRFRHPGDALRAGIGMVHQELAFCDNMTVAENLCLGDLPRRNGFLSRRRMAEKARVKLASIGAEIDVQRTVGDLPVSQQQLLQIAEAVGRRARVIVFDEPTSSLTRHETERLYGLIRRLKGEGVTCLYVSHRMEEIFDLCDTVTVLRDGRHVETLPTDGLDEGGLVRRMIGRSLDEYFPAHLDQALGEELLRVEDLRSPGKLHGVSFSVRAGEILGFAGLVGSGRTEIAEALFGVDPGATGKVFVAGKPVTITRPAEAMAQGLGLVPEDRKRQGLVLGMSVLANTTLPILERLSRFTWVRRAAERALASDHVSRLRVRTPGLDAAVAGLSGGNQQKIVLARWLAAHCRVLILDEPTRGVDVGAKAEIHALVDQLAAAGNAVLLISSELPEVMRLSTRVLVIRDGRVVGELSRERLAQDALLRLMAGIPAASTETEAGPVPADSGRVS